MRKLVLTVSVVLSLFGRQAWSVDVRAVEESSVAWQTVHVAEPQVAVSFPDGATHAEVSVVDLSGRQVTIPVAAGETHVSWKPFEGAAPKEDNAYTLTISYYRDSSILSRETACVVVARGAFGDAIDAHLSADDAAWRQASKRQVWCLDSRWMAETADATAMTVTVSRAESVVRQVLESPDGWFAAALPWKSGAELTVSSVFAGTDVEWLAELTLVGKGLMVLVK